MRGRASTTRNDEFWDVTPLVGIEPIKYQYTIELRRGIGLNQIVDPGKANWDVANSFISQVRGIKIKYQPKTPADMHVYVNKRYRDSTLNIGIFWESDEHAPAYIVKWEGPVNGQRKLWLERDVECYPLTTPRTAGCDGDPELTVPSHYRFKAGWGADNPMHPHYFTAGDYTFMVSPCPTAGRLCKRQSLGGIIRREQGGIDPS